MRMSRQRPGIAGMRRAIGLVFLVAFGCSEQEELKPDPGVSPFYPAPSSDEAKATGSGAAPSVITANRPATDRETPLRPDEIEKQLRIALRAAEREDLERARTLLDQILAVEPIHREALAGRAAVALAESKKAATPEARLADVEKASEFVRTLRRAYERPNQRELALAAGVNYEEVRLNTKLGRLDRALEIIKEVHKAGFDPFDTIDRDPDLAKLREMPGYKALIKSIDDERLAKAKTRLKDELARTPNFPFDFDVKTLDGQQLSLEKLRGKVVLVDFWGTWCKPCREAIPGLMGLYQKNRRRGFEIIGLGYEKNAPDPETAEKQVKQFVEESKIPYPIAMGDEALIEKVPGFQAYPTTLLIDRTGKVRLLLAGGGPEAHDIIDAGVEVLLAEPASGTAPEPNDRKQGAPKSGS